MEINKYSNPEDFDKIKVGWWWAFCCDCDMEIIEDEKHLESVKCQMKTEMGSAYPTFNECYILANTGFNGTQEMVDWCVDNNIDLQSDEGKMAFKLAWEE